MCVVFGELFEEVWVEEGELECEYVGYFVYDVWFGGDEVVGVVVDGWEEFVVVFGGEGGGVWWGFCGVYWGGDG